MKLIFFSPEDNSPPEEVMPSSGGPKQSNQYTNRISQAEAQFMRDNWQTMTTLEIAQALGRSKATIGSYASKVLKLTKSPEALYMARCKGHQSLKNAYTEVENQYLRDNWQTMTSQEMADALGRPKHSVKVHGRRKLGLKKNREAIVAISSRPNTGQFKKGDLPGNTVFGDEQVIRIRHNYKRNIKTKYIRLGLAKWQSYQHYNWEQANGPVPKGMVLIFVDGDSMNVVLENLKLITMAENALRNSGTINLPDSYVASRMAVRQPELKKALLEQPELIDLQRKTYQLKRTIKQHDCSKPRQTRKSRKRNG